MSVAAEERFWVKVDRRGPEECWEWTAARTDAGYGGFWFGKRVVGAHRVAYQMVVGPIPVGLQLDHLCRNRACVNPSHLEPVTVQENQRRGVGPIAEQMRRTHCIHGHEFTPENTYRRREGGRMCRECKRANDRRYHRGRAS